VVGGRALERHGGKAAPRGVKVDAKAGRVDRQEIRALASWDAGRAVGMGGRRARQTRTGHRRTGRVTVLGRPGRKKKGIPPHVVRRVLWGAGRAGWARRRPGPPWGIPDLSRHTIRSILEEHGMVNRMGRRARRVPWAGFEREHSNPVWSRAGRCCPTEGGPSRTGTTRRVSLWDTAYFPTPRLPTRRACCGRR